MGLGLGMWIVGDAATALLGDAATALLVELSSMLSIEFVIND
jgi:hypothetical protein